jgi:hypothetical protein
MHKPINERVAQPTPQEVRAARKAAGLTQTQAASLVSPAQGRSAYRRWQGYEAEIGQSDHRAIPLSTWELFLLLIDQHPTLRLVSKRAKTKSGDNI